MILGDILRRNARLYPNKTAFIFEERRLSFLEFDRRVNRLIHTLAAFGIQKGDRVAILSKNCPEYLEVYGAAEKGGRVIVPLNFRLLGRELSYIVNNAEVTALVVDREYVETIQAIRSELTTVQHYLCIGDRPQDMFHYEDLLAGQPEHDPQVSVDEDDLAYIIYTSGTTGLPKGAMLTHKGQIEDAKSLLMELGIRHTDKHLAMMPFYHGGGKAICLTHFYRGCTTVITTGFDPRAALEIIQRERITTTQVVPSMIAFMLDLRDIDRYDLSSLNMIFYASSPMPTNLLKRAMRAFGPIFFQAYGQTESGPVVTVLSKEDHILEGAPAEVRRLGSCGLPAMNVEARVVDDQGRDAAPGQVGEIIVKSELVMKGYWKNPEATASAIRDGWLYTGDLATVDEAGYIYIVDRKKDMIISGGENIYPREVEEVLYQHPAVLEVAVIGAPDEKWGESVKAIIVLKREQQATEEEIIQFCKENMASYKKPKSVEFVESLPKNPSGKVLKRELREKYWQGYERRVH